MGLILWIHWLIVSWTLAGKMSRSAKYPRLAFLLTYLFLFLVPSVDWFVKAAIADFHRYRNEQEWPASPLVVSGYLASRDKNTELPVVWEYLAAPYNFHYVEVEYTGEPGFPTPKAGPGFYQFVSAPPGTTCFEGSMRDNGDGIVGIGGRCLRFSRTDRPVSKYAYVSEQKELWPSIAATCWVVVEVTGRKHVATFCSYGFGPWWGWFEHGGTPGDPNFPFPRILQSSDAATP